MNGSHGDERMDTPVRDAVINRCFGDVPGNGYHLKSDPDGIYNCIAWAASVTNIRWWPTPYPIDGYYWPSDAPRSETLEAFVAAFSTLEYTDCAMDGSLEIG